MSEFVPVLEKRYEYKDNKLVFEDGVSYSIAEALIMAHDLKLTKEDIQAIHCIKLMLGGEIDEVRRDNKLYKVEDADFNSRYLYTKAQKEWDQIERNMKVGIHGKSDSAEQLELFEQEQKASGDLDNMRKKFSDYRKIEL